MANTNDNRDPRLGAADLTRDAFVGRVTAGAQVPGPRDQQLEAIPPAVWRELPEHALLSPELPAYRLRYRQPCAEYNVFLLSGDQVVGVFRGAELMALHSKHNDIRLFCELILAAFAQRPWSNPQRMLSETRKLAFEKAWQLAVQLARRMAEPKVAPPKAAAGPSWAPPPPELRIEMPAPSPREEVKSAAAIEILELPDVQEFAAETFAASADDRPAGAVPPAASAGQAGGLLPPGPSRPAATASTENAQPEARAIVPPPANPTASPPPPKLTALQMAARMLPPLEAPKPLPTAMDAEQATPSASVTGPSTDANPPSLPAADAPAKQVRVALSWPAGHAVSTAAAAVTATAAASQVVTSRSVPVPARNLPTVRLHLRAVDAVGRSVCSVCGLQEQGAAPSAQWTSQRAEYMKSDARCYLHPE